MKKILFLFAIICSMLYSCSSSFNDDDDLENVGTPGGSNPDALKPTDIGYKFKESEIIDGVVYSIPGITNGNSRKLKSIYVVDCDAVPRVSRITTFKYDSSDRLIEEKLTFSHNSRQWVVTDNYEYLSNGEPILRRSVKGQTVNYGSVHTYDVLYNFRINKTYNSLNGVKLVGEITSKGQLTGWFSIPLKHYDFSVVRRIIDFGHNTNYNYMMTTGNSMMYDERQYHRFNEYFYIYSNEFISLSTEYESETWEESNPFIVYIKKNVKSYDSNIEFVDFLIPTKVKKIKYYGETYFFTDYIDYKFGKDSSGRILWKTSSDLKVFETTIYNYK